MARVVKAYACRFRCGERVNTHLSSILRHERQCFKNPKNKACPACIFNKREVDDYGGYYFVCEKDKKAEDKIFIKGCSHFEASP